MTYYFQKINYFSYYDTLIQHTGYTLLIKNFSIIKHYLLLLLLLLDYIIIYKWNTAFLLSFLLSLGGKLQLIGTKTQQRLHVKLQVILSNQYQHILCKKILNY